MPDWRELTPAERVSGACDDLVRMLFKSADAVQLFVTAGSQDGSAYTMLSPRVMEKYRDNWFTILAIEAKWGVSTRIVEHNRAVTTMRVLRVDCRAYRSLVSGRYQLTAWSQ